MTKTLKRSIGITFILILISALSGGGITLGMAVFSGNYISGIFFLLYILLFLIALIYSSSNVIFALPCKKFLRTLFFVLWLISYSVLSYCLLFAWIFLGSRFSDICWNINYLMNHCLNSVAILMIPLKWFWVVMYTTFRRFSWECSGKLFFYICMIFRKPACSYSSAKRSPVLPFPHPLR